VEAERAASVKSHFVSNNGLYDGAKIAGLKFARWKTHVPHASAGTAACRVALVQSAEKLVARHRRRRPSTPAAGADTGLGPDGRLVGQNSGYAKADVTPLIGEATDDINWDKTPLGILAVGQPATTRRAVLRRHFTVPANWAGGRVAFWLLTDGARSFVDTGHLYLSRLDRSIIDVSP
jgi:hypothetical protein